jgi:hypothetical protein
MIYSEIKKKKSDEKKDDNLLHVLGQKIGDI